MDTPALSLSTTGFAEASQCLRKYQYHFVDHLVPLPRAIKRPLRRGIWAHRCLQDYHRGENWLRSLDALEEWARERGVAEEDVVEIGDEVTQIMLGYIDYYGPEGWEPLYTEHEFRPTFGQMQLRATVDLIAKTPFGTVLVEHKTTREIPPPYWRAIDPQTAIQWVTAMESGVQLDGILFNYLLTTPPSVPRIKKDGEFYANTATTTGKVFDWVVDAALSEMEFSDPLRPYYHAQRAQLVDDGKFYQRFLVTRDDKSLVSSMADVAATAEHILLARKQNYYPRSFHITQCRNFCPYSDLCIHEYVEGGINEARRLADFSIDDGTREGQAA